MAYLSCKTSFYMEWRKIRRGDLWHAQGGALGFHMVLGRESQSIGTPLGASIKSNQI